jgi:hypothetical protein
MILNILRTPHEFAQSTTILASGITHGVGLERLRIAMNLNGRLNLEIREDTHRP